jgi:hypothetical protein
VKHHVLRAMVSAIGQKDTYQSLEWKLKRFVLRWDEEPRRRHLRWMSSLDLDDLSRAAPSGMGATPATLAGSLAAGHDSLNAILALDFSTYLPGSVLTKVDRASMAHGLEVRPPMLDNEVVDFAFRVPSSLKVRGGTSKYLLQLAARTHLPDAIVSRRKKGFGIPLARWLRGPLRHRLASVLSSSPLWESPLLDRAVFAGMAGMHDRRRGDHSKPLWALIVLDEWMRREKVTPDFVPDSVASRPPTMATV